MKSHTLSHLDEFVDYSNNKLNIVLDLDNTIIYTKIFNSNDILKIKYYFLFKNENLLGKFEIEQKTYLVYIRPYFTYFLNTIKMYFNLYVYTNSQEIYCKNIINLLREKYLYFEIKKIICRNDNTSLIKRLSLICENHDDLHFLNAITNYHDFVKETIIIDDNIDVWKFDKNNVINVKKYDESVNFFKLSNDAIFDDTLLILTNRLFLIYNLYFSDFSNNDTNNDINTNINTNTNDTNTNDTNTNDTNDDNNNYIVKLISKYKLYDN
jgi:hypothetical protein